MGECLLVHFQCFVGYRRLVGDIRGMGLLNAVELVEDKASKTPLREAGVTGLIAHALENGVLLGRNGNTIPGRCNILLISPPLILNRMDADKIVEAVAAGLASISG